MLPKILLFWRTQIRKKSTGICQFLRYTRAISIDIHHPRIFIKKIRITQGSLSGRYIPIPSPEKNTVRPTKSVVKEAIFHIVASMLEDAVFLDIFAGSGSMGIEAISRGAKCALFVECDPTCVNILKTTVRDLKIEGRSQIFRRDIFSSLSFLKIPADIIYLDPPYKMPALSKKMETLVQNLLDGERLKKTGCLFLEMPKDAPFSLNALFSVKKYTYGGTTIWKISH